MPVTAGSGHGGASITPSIESGSVVWRFHGMECRTRRIYFRSPRQFKQQLFQGEENLPQSNKTNVDPMENQ